ncbi:hypothetical protein ACQ1ZD_14665, partial [Enterococcus faecalis]|uniref:hypothetical protein n=1 Tax=Enterococcus faecalis TaxID=1351 RepID=UPI003D6AAD80
SMPWVPYFFTSIKSVSLIIFSITLQTKMPSRGRKNVITGTECSPANAKTFSISVVVGDDAAWAKLRDKWM